MAKNTERVFIRNARLSYPALDRPRESMAGQGAPKYQATFLLEPDNPSVAKLKEAIRRVAIAEWGPEKGEAALRNRDKVPLKKGDERETVPDGYQGMLYIAARSAYAPELRDSNPRILIKDEQTIKEKFVPGYKVNGYVDLCPYAVRNDKGVVIKSGIGCGLISVQFAGYADAFVARSTTRDEDYPDCSAEVEASQAYDAPASGSNYDDIPF